LGEAALARPNSVRCRLIGFPKASNQQSLKRQSSHGARDEEHTHWKASEFLTCGDKVENEIEFQDRKGFTETVMRNSAEVRKILLDLGAIQ
jgi:hypothetical protein